MPAIDRPEVFDETIAPGLRTSSTRAKTRCLMSSRSTTTSMIQSHSPRRCQSSSKFRPRQRQEALRVEQRRLRLLDVLEPGERELVAEAGIVGGQPLLEVVLAQLGGHDVEHHHPDPGVGKMGGDPRAHHTGTEHRDRSNLSRNHSTSLVS
jgi:hypothetical protein